MGTLICLQDPSVTDCPPSSRRPGCEIPAVSYGVRESLPIYLNQRGGCLGRPLWKMCRTSLYLPPSLPIICSTHEPSWGWPQPLANNRPCPIEFFQGILTIRYWTWVCRRPRMRSPLRNSPPPWLVGPSYALPSGIKCMCQGGCCSGWPMRQIYCSRHISGGGGYPCWGSPLCNGHSGVQSGSVGFSNSSLVPGTHTIVIWLPGPLLGTKRGTCWVLRVGVPPIQHCG